MKKVKLTKMTLTNFKGIRYFETAFNGRTRIFGDNATGKTTIVDAFTWLLFGKDSTGRKDFSIKTYDMDNKIIHKLDHEVTGTFDIDGEEMVLRRVYKEKWVTRRGSEEPELQGHETLFFWNDVPLQAGEYQSKVDDIITEQTFRMITSPWYFNSLKWQDRREILTSIAGDVSDRDIAAKRLDFSALFSDMGNKTLEEYKKELAARKKKLKKELEEIPARIDEVVRNTPDAKDWNAIQAEIDSLKKDIENIDAQIADSTKANEAFLQAKRNRQDRIHQVKILISDFEFKGRQEFSKRAREKKEAIDNANAEIEKINRKVKADVAEINDLKERIKSYEAKQAKLRDEWIKLNSHDFPGFGDDFKCPTCRQELPADEIELKKKMMLSNFNNNKESKLNDISGEGRSLNPIIDNLKGDIKNLESFDYTKQVKEQEAIIQNWEKVHLVSVQEILSENAEYQNLKKELEELENHPEPEMTSVDNSAFKLQKADINFKIDSLNKVLSIKEQISISDSRKKELLRQEKEFAKQLAELEHTEFTIQEFTRAKVDALECKINGMFEGVKFRLFDTQLNGGIVECCDTLIDGVPWSDANNAAKINAGISIINVLTAYYGQIAPVFIDNAESITRIQKSNAQIIELYVSEAHKELEVKVA